MDDEVTEYSVKIPFDGWIEVTVEADDEETAKASAMEMAHDVQFEIPNTEEGNLVDMWEYQFAEKLLEGNFCYMECWSIEVEEL